MGDARRVVVVGGGAAGLVAAICAARAGACVTVLEAAKRVGQKILKTGNGRCNLTNTRVSAADFNNAAFVEPIISQYPAVRVLDFFESLGLLAVEESEGRVYPLSNTANTVLDVLRAECERLQVETVCGCEVVSIRKLGFEFELACGDGALFFADRVIVATGGGTRLLERAGHSIVPFQPVLCPLLTDTKPLRGLSGIRAHARVSLQDAASLEGEVLFRDYGLSGIVIFDMSRLVHVGDWLSLDFFPAQSEYELLAWLEGRLVQLGACGVPSYSELMCGMLHTRLNDAVARAAGLRPSEPAQAAKLPALAAAAKNFRLQVTGFGDPKQAQVTRGGACTSEFNASTLESQITPGLYAAGEALDVDGRCGGFNLHWAWASGIVAGESAANEG